ncbi:MAG: O-antigen ligase family protein, partial [bacterium]
FIFVFEDIVMQRLQTAGHQEHRRVMIAMALKFIAQNPVFGVGLWNYQFHSFGDFRFWHAVHNMFLRLGAELGIPGLLLFLIRLFNSFKNCLIGLKFRDRFLNHIALAIMGGQLAFIIAAMFNPQYAHYRHKFLFWFLIGLGVAIKRMGLKEAFIAFQNRKKRMLKEREEEDIGLIDIE